jgi:hypothetical protein
VDTVTGKNRDLQDAAMRCLVALFVGFAVAAHVLPQPWVLAFAGVVGLAVAVILVWVVVAVVRDRR